MSKHARYLHQLPAWLLVVLLVGIGSGYTWDEFDWEDCANDGWNSGDSPGPNCGVNTWYNSGTNWGVNHGENQGINLNYNAGANDGINLGTNTGENYGINLGWNRGVNYDINNGYIGPQLRCGVKCFNEW